MASPSVPPPGIPRPSIDFLKHAGEEGSTGIIEPPLTGSAFELDEAVHKALVGHGITLVSAYRYGMSHWAYTAKVEGTLPDGVRREYFLKTAVRGEQGKLMIEGEYESLKAIYEVMPKFVTQPYSWGEYQSSPGSYFIITQFREIIGQPPEPVKFTERLAEMHRRSRSPTGKFGFHVTTCRAIIEHLTNIWEDSWAKLYSKQLAYLMKLDREKNGEWPEFHHVCQLTLQHVIPRLLLPLQSDGRSIKPCLVHGDLWDENTATDATNGETFLFDACSFYAHNEYEIGNWRAVRHTFSRDVYVDNYKKNFPPSEPVEDWDDRNLLYSLRFDLGTAILMPTSPQRRVVMDNMTVLCKKFCEVELYNVPN